MKSLSLTVSDYLSYLDIHNILISFIIPLLFIHYMKSG
jgi:hypothetical protein